MVDVSKTTSYVVLSPRAQVSKTVFNTVLKPATAQVSKATTQVALTPSSVTVSKGTAQAVLGPNKAVVSKTVTQVVLYRPPFIRVPKLTAQVVLNKPTPAEPTFTFRANRNFVEAITNGTPELRFPRVFAESTTGGEEPLLACPRVFLEVICDILEEPPMLDPETQQLPVSNLPGMTMSVTKSPTFSTKVSGIVSGREVRNALYDDPRWEFTVSFDYLPDKMTGATYIDYTGNTQLRQLEGFFMQCRGSYQSFLFRDMDDYQTVSVFADGDGSSNLYYIRRDLGGFRERIGQLNTAEPYSFWKCPTNGESKTVPASGPYTVTVNQAATFVTNVKVTNTSGTIIYEPVTGVPGAYQYNVSAGVYTFNPAQAGEGVKIYYGYAMTQGVDYTLVGPNRISLTSLLPSGTSIGGSFQFYFVCRFSEDVAEFEKFYDKLWELNELSFRSIIQ